MDGASELNRWLEIQQEQRDNVSDELLVPYGLGAPKGFTPEQHVNWAVRMEHPCRYELDTCLDIDSKTAAEFQCSNTPEDIDSFVRLQMDQLERTSNDLLWQKELWLQEHGLAEHALARKLHGPLFIALIKSTNYDQFDANLAEDIAGSPLIGMLPPSGSDVREKIGSPCTSHSISEMELAERRRMNNELIVKSLRRSDWDHELFELAAEDSVFGCSSEPKLITEWHMKNVTLCRRIPVREERSKGWRTRPVDHETECDVNPETVVPDRAVYDSTASLVLTLLFFMRAGIEPLMWKRDVHKAFRRLVVKPEHAEFAWSVFPYADQVWVVQHFGMPFRAVSSNQAWHRVGSFIRFLVRRIFLTPVNRFVDDFFGASRRGVQKNGGWIMSQLCTLLGLALDEEKSEDLMTSMVVLGSRIQVIWEDRRVTSRIDEAVAKKWSEMLKAILDKRQLHPDAALKMAGLLGAAVTCSLDRVGRAFVKPFFFCTSI